LPIPVDHADTFINQTQDISEALLTIHNASFNIRISNSLVNSFNCTNLAGDTNIIDNGSLKYTPKLNELAFIVKDVLERIVKKIVLKLREESQNLEIGAGQGLIKIWGERKKKIMIK